MALPALAVRVGASVAGKATERTEPAFAQDRGGGLAIGLDHGMGAAGLTSHLQPVSGEREIDSVPAVLRKSQGVAEVCRPRGLDAHGDVSGYLLSQPCEIDQYLFIRDLGVAVGSGESFFIHRRIVFVTERSQHGKIGG